MEKEIKLDVSNGSLSGTLIVPDNIEKPTIVLIVAGSGPTDRDGNNRLSGETNNLKQLAEQLAAHNVASLRFDKRGVGKSQSATIPENQLRLQTFVTDVLSWVRYLSESDKFSKIFILGHSEGGLISIEACQKLKAAGLILLATPGRNLANILQDQLTQQLSGQEEWLQRSIQILDSLKNGNLVPQVPVELETLFRPSIQPYLQSILKIDPVIELTKLKLPILLIQGTEDLQVSVSDAELLKQAVPTAKLAIIPKMNHVLKIVPESDTKANLASYQQPDKPLSSELVQKILNFLNTEDY
ncbi:alpha/beta hydrolase [Ligilactobacillus sp. WILCCON 0076]|uniref:Alpha/beta hydrolase n=1 Tax=Ligilactobacillus ubinensis TaxID=2876789 RepID=A0A9X2FL37_9LACO|nr:alpha/beta fold hydrolase [Ligilactobacillus ubinensis]MCP0887360.1 alpha/beta hydrolase [Ligilactobacillus ubinensis]